MTTTSTSTNYRLIDIDSLDTEDVFPEEVLKPTFDPIPTSTVQQISQHCRQLLQRGEQYEALKLALENVPYGADDLGKTLHLQTIVEILSSIKSLDMSSTLSKLFSLPNGTELLDVLMKYLYKGMASSVTGGSGTNTSSSISSSNVSTPNINPEKGQLAAVGGKMSVLLSWHEKVVDIAGEGSIVRVMTDRRTI